MTTNLRIYRIVARNSVNPPDSLLYLPHPPLPILIQGRVKDGLVATDKGAATVHLEIPSDDGATDLCATEIQVGGRRG
jgi:hypothetical protein